MFMTLSIAIQHGRIMDEQRKEFFKDRVVILTEDYFSHFNEFIWFLTYFINKDSAST